MQLLSDRDIKFVAHLTALQPSTANGRAALARLRRGLGKTPGEAHDVHRFVVPWLNDSDSDWVVACFYLVASLYASYCDSAWNKNESSADGDRNLGASFAVWRRLEPRATERLARHFGLLVSSERNELSENLRHAISLFRSREVPVDWAVLLGDLRRWDQDHHPVQFRWAREFWRDSMSQSDATDNAAAFIAAERPNEEE